MIELYNAILYKPVLNLLVYLYNIVPGHDIGVAIIILTIIIKLILLPLSIRSIKSQKALQDIQPKLEKLKKQYKDQKDKLASETMLLYKEQKVNPLSSCLPLLIQFPFLIAVYHAFRTGLTGDVGPLLYSFVNNPGQIDTVSFGIIDLAIPSIWLAILAGLAQYLQTKMLTTQKTKKPIPGAKDENMMASMNKSMQYFMPFITILIGMRLPGGLTFYWFLTTILTALQQQLIFKNMKKQPVEIIPPKDTDHGSLASIKTSRSGRNTDQPPEIKKLPDNN